MIDESFLHDAWYRVGSDFVLVIIISVIIVSITFIFVYVLQSYCLGWVSQKPSLRQIRLHMNWA